MPGLFPVFEVPGTIIEERKLDKKFKPAPFFDIEKGDFLITGANRLIYGSGYDAWVFWCTKTVLTQRWSCLAYSENAGIEIEQAFAQKDRAAVESHFERTITEALLADPKGRTVYVKNFEFKWLADAIYF